MLDLFVKFDDITISNIEKNHLEKVKEFIEYEGLALNKVVNCFEVLEERFLESYLSECEFFARIDKKDKLIGIIKGRVEFKSLNELWIWYYCVNEFEEKSYLKKRVLEELLSYFNEEFNINSFYTRVIKDESLSVDFWKQIGFIVNRVVKDYYNIDGIDKDMLILMKQRL